MFAAETSLSVLAWFEALTPHSRYLFAGRRLNNLLHYMIELLESSVSPSLELWAFYWSQSPFVQYMASAYYITSKRDVNLKRDDSLMLLVIRYVPFPLLRQMFRKYGWGLLAREEELRPMVAG